MPLEILEVHFDCAGSQNLGGRGGCLALVVVLCAFLCMVATFRDRRKRETSCSGGPKSTFRDWRLYFEVQIPWQVHHFGYGGDLGRALIFRQVQGIVTFLHVAHKSGEVSPESCVLAFGCRLWKRSCGEMPWQGCGM